MLLVPAIACGAADDEDITFAPKNWWDTGESVGISGTLTGDDIAYRNNTYAIACYNQLGSCFATSVEQIGPKQIGRMDYPYRLAIIQWTPYEVVARDEASCVTITVTLSRKSQTALWVEQPTDKQQPFCNPTKIHNWTIEDSLGWKRIHGAR